MAHPKLSLNIDHVATLRQARNTPYPDPVEIAMLAQLGGADGITVHPREDRRHIQDRDVNLLNQILQIPLTLEMALTTEMVDMALEIKPYACTLVPELREELTTESGMKIVGRGIELLPKVQRLLDADIYVSVFVDPDVEEIMAAHSLGVDYVELHTGSYALANSDEEENEQFETIMKAAVHAKELGLGVNVGHGLHFHNTERITALPMIDWVHTGHSIVAHSLSVGMERAVREMKDILTRSRLFNH